MTGESEPDRGATVRTVLEIAAIGCLFAAAATWPAPDVNEAVYLTKARHAADPAWAAGDFFLETPDAHGVFYLLFGPLAAALPLEQAAWVGRVLGWLAVAIGFRHAIVPLVATAWGRIIAAALFSLALRHTTMAGEGCSAAVRRRCSRGHSCWAAWVSGSAADSPPRGCSHAWPRRGIRSLAAGRSSRSCWPVPRGVGSGRAPGRLG